MSIFSSYQDAPPAADGADSSATDYMRLWQNGRLLDMLSLRGRDAFQAHSERPEPVNTNPLEYWNGGFIFRVGMTTATFVLVNQLTRGTERFRVKFNGVQVADVLMTAGTQVVDVTLTGRGYADWLSVEVNLEIHDPTIPANNPQGIWGRYELIVACVAPLSTLMPTVWPGTPTFTSAFSVPLWNQLAAASDWLALRLSVVPMPLLQSILFATGEYWLNSNKTLWTGGGARSGSINRFVSYIGYDIVSNLQETLRIKVNGSVVSTLGPLNAGQRGAHLYQVDLSGYPDNTPLRLEWDSFIASDPATPRPEPSRYSLYSAAIVPSSVAFAAMPAPIDFLQDLTWPQFRDRLNGLSALFAAIKARIDANPDLFERGYMFRGAYGFDAGQREYFQFRHRPFRQRRLGNVLAVRGKGVTINWGPGTVKAPAETGGEYTAENQYSETIIPNDAVASKLIYLDTLPGLDVGAAYNLGGADIRLAVEFLR